MIYAAVDIETKDPHLKKWGPGSIRNDGFIIGIGVYAPSLSIKKFFKPNDKELRDFLRRTDICFIMHNAVYDLDWLVNGPDHFEINTRIEDTMTRETLLDSYALSYSLEACCYRRGLVGKNKTETIDTWWAERGKKGKAIEHLDEIPFEVVGRYCLQDCKATYDLFEAQQPLLEQQDLLNANDIEARLYPWLMHTRRNGMRLDWKARAALSDMLMDELEQLERDFRKEYGDANINSSADLERIWKREGIPLEYTATGRPSFAAGVLEEVDAPVAKSITRMRMLQKLLDTFIDGQFVDLAYNGRLWPVLYPAKRDQGGTVTGRFSSREPNAQNIPARADKYGKEIRSLFIPEDNCALGAFDFKQIEYRVFLHFASGPGADDARAKFLADPNTDYHQMVVDMMGWGNMGKEGRHLAKNFNFGVLYGLGKRSFADRFGIALIAAHPGAKKGDEFALASMLMDEYEHKVPFARGTSNLIQNVGTKRGYVKTLSGRRQRLPPDQKNYKLVNYLVSGSAADIIKKSIVDSWEAGVWNTLKCHDMVHDELMFSSPETKEGFEACIALKGYMENAYRLSIPIGVDTEVGPDWGHCDGDNWEQYKQKYTA